MITTLIILAEISFWIFILLGFFTRYVLKKKKMSLWLLGATPVIDLLLLIFVVIDLSGGAEATFAHTIAAIYLGVSIAFGKSMIAWADVQFQYYFLKTDKRPPKLYGLARGKKELIGFSQHLLAYFIGGLLLAGMFFFLDNESSREVIIDTFRLWSLILGIDFVIALSYVLFPSRKKT